MKNKKTTIYLVRHGDVENPDKIIYGYLPLPLSAKGVKQAEQVAKFFKQKNIARIYSSPVYRCRQTAGIIAEKLGKAVQTAKALTESELAGGWQGTPVGRMNQKFEKSWSTYKKNPAQLIYQGVGLADVARRMTEKIQEIAEKNFGKNLVIVSHGDPIKAFVLAAEEGDFKKLRSLPCYYCCIIRLFYDGKNFSKYKIIRKGRGRLVQD